MNIKERFSIKRNITTENIPQGDDVIIMSNDSVVFAEDMQKVLDEVKRETFDKILKAFNYLQGDSKHEPDFSILEIARAAIALYHDMYDNNDNSVTGIKHQTSWSKEDLGLFISNLFETLLDFLDNGEATIQ